ncbi:MAG: LysM peptidoglycan-binding domain-containing protein [Anaerolineae bacterium]|nr:LysM peptidoglycan-binding domain-containing protein [Anaerolineae bacterium]
MIRIAITLIALLLTGCVRNQPPVVVVITATATTQAIASTPTALATTISPTEVLGTDPAVVALRGTEGTTEPQEYVVQSGDTLSGIAAQFGISLDVLIAANALINPDVLSVGQVINLPEVPRALTPAFQILPDSRLVKGPGSSAFSTAAFVGQLNGYIRLASDTVDDVNLNAVQVIDRVATEFSVDARLLLALLEHKARWLSNPAEPDEMLLTYPIQGGPSPDGFERGGLYRQLSWAANQINRGYYGWKHTELSILNLADGTRLRYDTSLNAATVGLQFFFGLSGNALDWQQDVSPAGFLATYQSLFGDPFASAADSPVPADLQQPLLTLPFRQGEIWFFTGGPHGGWGSGSAWAAVDFAPPDERPDGSAACYVSVHQVTAVADGLIVRSDDGVVVLDLDSDGDESTGWSILYLHLATEGRAAVGSFVRTGDPIGYPSCEGGFSNGTHLHIARRYNGEWIPADSPTMPTFVMSGWGASGLANQEYQGYLINGSERRTADQGRISLENRISW